MTALPFPAVREMSEITKTFGRLVAIGLDPKAQIGLFLVCVTQAPTSRRRFIECFLLAEEALEPFIGSLIDRRRRKRGLGRFDDSILKIL